MSLAPTPDNISGLSDESLRLLLADAVKFQKDDVKENQLLYYQPVSPIARSVHRCTAKTVGLGGGNRSSKTETALVELIIACTGIVPYALRDDYPMEKLRGPITTRIVIESITTVLYPTLLPKLQWWRWQGADEPGGARGHWGWIPRTSLIDGSWDKSWSEKNRILRLHYRDPVSHEIVGESTIQVMSHDQDPSDFESGDLHFCLNDEIPRYAAWRANQARTMAVRGRMFLAMTWKDDASIPVDWIFDEVYDRAQPGPMKDPNFEWFELHSTDNPNIDQQNVREQMATWNEATRAVRIYGRPLRFSNRIHPLFTDTPSAWCFKCGTETVLRSERCSTCDSEDVTAYCHVQNFDYHRSWPVLCLLDPHPRKPHALAWIAVDSYDDLWQVAELEVSADPVELRLRVDDIERTYGLNVAQRIMDPKMGESPADAKDREATWQTEFRKAGLYFDLADSSSVGRDRVNSYLKPDPKRLAPRLHIHERCVRTIHQMKRFCWDEHRESLEKDLKQQPKRKNDDFPALWRYALNTDPSFVQLTRGALPINYAR